MSLEITLKPLIVLVLGTPGNETVMVNCSSFSGTFAINTVPGMTVGIAADAINLRTNASTTSNDFTQFDETTPATVWFKLSHPDIEIGDIWGKIFEGEFAGFDIQRNSSRASYTVTLRHSLAYLNYVSAISSNSHPSNPADFSFPAVMRQQGNITGSTARTWVPGIDRNLVTDVAMQDLWTNVLQKWLTSLAMQEPADQQLLASQGLTSNSALRQKIIDTVRIITIAPEVPLSLPVSAASDPVRANIKSMLLNSAIGAEGDFVHVTMWGKLLTTWAPEFLFELLPRAVGCWVVPSVGALNAEAYPPLDITFDQITDISMNSSMDQELQAVVLTQPGTELTGYNGTNVPPQTNQFRAYGLYKPYAGKSGVVVIRQPPAWLSRCPTSSRQEFSPQVVNTAMDPVSPTSTPGDTPQDRSEPARLEMKNLADRYAQQLYINERLKGRMAQITGILRFDIVPGSHVRFSEPLSGVSYIGKVVQVSILMDAEAKAVGTTLLLSNIRTQKEDAAPGYSLKSGALYSNFFVSGPLVDVATPPANVLAAAAALL